MPCRSYEDDYRTGSPTESWQYKELKANNDKLARIACKAMSELVKSGYADFLVLKDDEVRVWWEQHQEADRKAQEAKTEKARLAKIKKDALAKLTPEEKKILGIKK
jgi:cytosine/adenosine deaminase-related metal-dependent hydrolase